MFTHIFKNGQLYVHIPYRGLVSMGKSFGVFTGFEHNRKNVTLGNNSMLSYWFMLGIAKVSLLICLISLSHETFAHRNLPPIL